MTLSPISLRKQKQSTEIIHTFSTLILGAPFLYKTDHVPIFGQSLLLFTIPQLLSSTQRHHYSNSPSFYSNIGLTLFWFLSTETYAIIFLTLKITFPDFTFLFHYSHSLSVILINSNPFLFS